MTTPHSAANDAAERSRSGLSPAAASRAAAFWGPTPLIARSVGAVSAVSSSSWASSSAISSSRYCQRRARVRSVSRAASVGVAGRGGGRNRAATATSLLGVHAAEAADAAAPGRCR